MSRTQKNRPDIEKLRREVELLREEIKTLTERVGLTLGLNEANLEAFVRKAKALITGEREKAIKILSAYQIREKTFIRRFLGWFGM